MLNSVKVPSDPAQVVVNHASFRVQLGSVPVSPATATAATPSASAPVPSTGTPGVRSGRRAPVVWSGRTESGSGDTVASELLRAAGLAPAGAIAAREAAGESVAREVAAREAGSTTQVLPRIEEGPASTGPRTRVSPTVVGPRSPEPPETTQPTPLLRGVRPAEGAFDDTRGFDGRGFEDARGFDGPHGGGPGFGEGHDTGREVPFGPAHADGGLGEPRRQAYYPGRRMNLGVVLLPLRVFLGFISIYAGMGKLCDPVYFDGGDRGSMVTWLHSLEPWTIAEPLRDFAIAHPVGAGLTVAFLQVIVGVLTMCGLWQRLAASIGALLSAALLVTVSWSTVPAYDAPDIIYLAAWSPLVIAGAPVYSVDSRLATEAWRRLGPRVDIWDLRRRVLRRGAVIATVVAGLALLIGSLLGGAVRSSHTATVPEPGEPPTNQLPGSPMPSEPGQGRTGSGAETQGQTTQGVRGGPDSRRSAGPSASASAGEHGRDGATRPSQRETVQAPQQRDPAQPPQQTTPGGPPPAQGGSTSTTGGGGGSTGGGSTGGGSSTSGGGDNGGSSSGGNGGGLGGLLG